MPIYEYQCQACGDVQEVLQKVDAPAPDACAVCQKGPMTKLLSRTAFILKGDGWYVTDFRDKGKKSPPATSESKGSETKSSESSSSSDSSSSSTPSDSSTKSSGDKGGGCGHSGACAHN